MRQTMASTAPIAGPSIAEYGNLLNENLGFSCATPANEPMPTDPRAALEPTPFRREILALSARPSQFTFSLQASAPAQGSGPRPAQAEPTDRNLPRSAAWTKPTIPDPGPGMIATEWADSDNESDSEDGTLRERGESRA